MSEKQRCTMYGSIFVVYPSEAALHINVFKDHTVR